MQCYAPEVVIAEAYGGAKPEIQIDTNGVDINQVTNSTLLKQYGKACHMKMACGGMYNGVKNIEKDTTVKCTAHMQNMKRIHPHIAYWTKGANTDFFKRDEEDHVFLFELLDRKVISKEQAEIIGKLINEDIGVIGKDGSQCKWRQRPPFIRQAIMGLGKTDVILPTLILQQVMTTTKGNETPTPRFEVNGIVTVIQPKHLVRATIEKIAEMLAPFLNPDEFVIDTIDTSTPGQKDAEIKKFTNYVLRGEGKGNKRVVLVMSDVTIKTLYLYCRMNKDDVGDWGSGFANHAIAINDEIDSMYKPTKSELNMPVDNTLVPHPMANASKQMNINMFTKVMHDVED
jgi:hypothetical protein